MAVLQKKKSQKTKDQVRIEKEAEIEHERVIEHWKQGLEDLKAGRVTRVR